LLAGAGSTAAQKGGGGGGGGLNTTTVSYTPINYTVTPTSVGSSSTVTITLADAGSSSLSIKTIAVSGAQAGDYTLGGTCANGAVIPRGSICQIQITFTPQAVGARAATVNASFLNANALNLPLSGQGVVSSPTISLSFAGPFTFPSKQVGAAPSPLFSDQLTTISNTGGQPLSISYSVIGPAAGDFVQGRVNAFGNCSPAILLPTLSQCNLGINFAPTAAGTRTATLRITTNDPLRPVVDIALSGVATAGPTPTPTPAPTPIASSADFTDLWGAAAEADWSLSINHHKATTDALVAVWHTHDVDGSDMWLELKDGHWTDGLTFTGNLHRLKGTPFSLPDDPNRFTDTVVGTATLTFTDFANGTLSYTVNGITGSKSISRVTY
jgi:hypothetical protein